MMGDHEQQVSEWVVARRGIEAGAGFARGVMAEIRSEVSGQADVAGAFLPGWVPRPALASACLVAGIAKLLLVVEVAF